MHTIILKINDSIYEKLLSQLNKYKKSELEIIIDDQNDLIKNKRYLEAELEEIKTGKSSFMGLEDLNDRLEKVIIESNDPNSMA
jgi:DNA-binding transcriptional regulator WhiA